MFVISTGKNTILTDFADLETKSAYQHQNAEATDFQFWADSHVFVEVNKKSGLDVMRVKENGTMGFKIGHVLKLKIENAYCIGCARQSFNEIAVGLSNGQVKVYNYRTSDVLHRFVGEKMKSVVCVDFNASDEYIAATHENGMINIYGNKTRAKLDSINIDSNSSLARFHPTKRFHLAIASYKGAVTVYDTGAKKKVFHTNDSHGAPCRDLSMSLALTDTLISVGYDCAVNIFDTRRKGLPIKLIQKHPLSTVALSGCGKFFCVGSLKGELITYDMRNTKTELGIKKIHDGAVNRVAFLPEVNCANQANANENLNASFTRDVTVEEPNCVSVDRLGSVEFKNEMRRSMITSRGQRDSFCDFMDFQLNKGIEKTSSRLTALANRDSFDWENLPNKHWTNRASVAYTGSNLSQMPINVHDTELVNEGKDMKADNCIEDCTHDDGNIKLVLKQPNQPLREPNAFISPIGKLIKIVEEQHLDTIPIGKELSSSSCSNSDKENVNVVLELHKQAKSSTPIVNAKPISHDTAAKSSDSPTNLCEVTKKIEDLRSYMDTRFKDLETELKFEAEQNKWQIFSQANDLWCKQYRNIEDIRSAMMFLLQTDPFVQEFKRLKEENHKLKEQLENMLKKH